MSKPIEQLDNPQLNEKLLEILQSGPLYSELRYRSAGLLHLPDYIQLFCPQCGRESKWQHVVHRNQTPNDKFAQPQQRSYRCANCKDQWVWFAYLWNDATEVIDGKSAVFSVFRKYGQLPPLEERVPARLEKALEASDDLQFYKAALRLRNFGHGIGAMAYMRRVVEGHMSEMLEILTEEAEVTNPQALPKGEAVPPRFVDKVAYAERLFPTVIAPQNYPNPFVPLYQLASDAIHNLSETESVALFDQCRHVFEYVFSTLRPHLKERKRFLDGLQNLAQLSTARRAD